MLLCGTGGTQLFLYVKTLTVPGFKPLFNVFKKLKKRSYDITTIRAHVSPDQVYKLWLMNYFTR